MGTAGLTYFRKAVQENASLELRARREAQQHVMRQVALADN